MNTKKLVRIMIVVLSCASLASCATTKNKSIIGIQGKEFGEVGLDAQACDIPKGYYFISPSVLDSIVQAKIEEMK